MLGRAPDVGVEDLPTTLHARSSNETAFGGPVVPMREIQHRYAAWALEQLGGRRMLTAEKLGVNDKTLARLLAEAAARAG